MDRKSKAIRLAAFEEIRLLAHASSQAEYEKAVPNADVLTELISGFCDDLYNPKSREFLDAFSEDELKDLAVLYGLLHAASERLDECRSVADLQKHPEWRSVMAFSKELVSRFDIGN